MASKKSTIEWGMWANEQALTSSVCGILGLAGSLQKIGLAIYSLIIGLFVLFLEYPRGRRKQGKTVERSYQGYLIPVIKMMGPVGSNYYIRFVLYLGMSIPTVFLLTSTLAGLSLLFSSFVYLAAAFVGEKWIGYEIVDGESRSPVKISEPPSRIPPRGPVEASDETTNDNFTKDENSASFQDPLYHAAVNLEVDMSKKNESVSIPKPFSRPVPSIHSDIEVSEHSYSIAEPPSRPPPRRPLQDESNVAIQAEQATIEISENGM